ncbi:putative integrase core domain protein [Danaus plexippus plexippus]|uniref:Integrase core domain protein n=1 Tax=Danaus plexippus plexippus TaxID=278856 RepID=A0A212F2T1_DANPL|nr:putative integrase core domain protein [Danaus plexippus plexippus]
MAETPLEFPVDVDLIATATKKDRVLSRVRHYILVGWPSKVDDKHLHSYWLHRSELSLHEDCVLLGCRVVIPPELRIPSSSNTSRALHVLSTSRFSAKYGKIPFAKEIRERLRVLTSIR